MPGYIVPVCLRIMDWGSIGGCDGGQAGTHGNTQGLKMQIKGRINRIRTVELT